MKKDIAATIHLTNPYLNHWVIGAGLIGGCLFLGVLVLVLLLNRGNAVWDFTNVMVVVPLLIFLGSITLSVILPKIIRQNSLQKSREGIHQSHDPSCSDDFLQKSARQASLSMLIVRLAPVEGAAFIATIFAFIAENFAPFIIVGAAIAYMILAIPWSDKIDWEIHDYIQQVKRGSVNQPIR